MNKYTKENVRKSLQYIGINKVTASKFLDKLSGDKEYTVVELEEVWLAMYPPMYLTALYDELDKIPARLAEIGSDLHYRKYFGEVSND